MRFIAEHAERVSADGLRWGVEPICRVLAEHGVQIAPSTYYASLTRPVSARCVRDEVVLAEIRAIQADRQRGNGCYGVRKMYRQLKRQGGVDGHPVPRCQVERLMRAAGMRGVRRDKGFKTTRPDASAARPPDLVDRDFSSDKPNELWLVDFTYVAAWAGMCFTAFVSAAFSRRIVGWRTASSDAHRTAAGRPGDGTVDPRLRGRGHDRGRAPQRGW